ncbi:MAG: hypothetical protein GY810_30735 [Aureispira sp.]|nr:hypothetical protein [Aureispira sp.]
MKKRKVKKSKRTTKMTVEVNLENALGNAHREQYIEDNPHGFRKVNRVHKSKKSYCRKRNKQNLKYA